MRKQDNQKDWDVFCDQLDALGFRPGEWLDLFQAFVEYKIKPLDFINSRRAAEKMASLMVMQLTNLALFAKSEQVRSSAAKELAYFGGLQPRKDDGLVNQTEEELDAQIRSYFGENEKPQNRREERVSPVDAAEDETEEAAIAALLQKLKGPAGAVYQKQKKDNPVLSGESGGENNNRDGARTETFLRHTPNKKNKSS